MLYEVTLRQVYFARNVINRWHYSSSGTPAAVMGSFALASAFGGIPDGITGEFPAASIMVQLAEIQSDDLNYVELQVEAMYDVADFYTVPYAPTQTGLSAGTSMSPFIAYALQSNRLRTDIRRGNKRLAGVVEEYVGAGGILESSIVAPLATLAEYMSDNLTYDDEGNTLTFVPVVLSFEKHAPDADHAAEWYSKYASNATQLEHAAVGVTWIAKQFVTTQNTRKN